MAGNVLIKNANGNTVTLQNPDTNLVDVVVDTSKIASKQYVDDADALKVALAAFTGANVSLAIKGYQKLPSGLIIQWASAAAGSFLFPITFPNGCFGIANATAGTATDRIVSISALTTSGGIMNTNIGNTTITYIVIGY